MPDSLRRLIYCSRNAIAGDAVAAEGEIQNILLVARRNNRAAGVTGALLFTHGCFVQALEGQRDELEAIFERIQCDERHRDVTVLAFESVLERAFPGRDLDYLGDTEAGDTQAMAAAALNGAFHRDGASGDSVLALMREVVAREKVWAGV